MVDQGYVEVRCIQCRQSKKVHATQAQLRAWRDGKLIQNAMPNGLGG